MLSKKKYFVKSCNLKWIKIMEVVGKFEFKAINSESQSLSGLLATTEFILLLITNK